MQVPVNDTRVKNRLLIYIYIYIIIHIYIYISLVLAQGDRRSGVRANVFRDVTASSSQDFSSHGDGTLDMLCAWAMSRFMLPMHAAVSKLQTDRKRMPLGGWDVGRLPLVGPCPLSMLSMAVHHR